MEAGGQFGLDLRPGEITAGQVLERIWRDSCDESEKVSQARRTALEETLFG